MNIKDILKEFKEELRILYKNHLKGVILFGSMARDNFTRESDIDVLIILDTISDYDDEFEKIFQIQRKIEKNYDDKIIISSVLAVQKDYNSRLEPLYLNVQKEGILV